MNFEAMSDNIRGLFTATRTYRIPRFQRDFSWDQTNYNEFFNDMLSQITFEQDSMKFHTSKYFLGNMLFLGNKEDEEVEVVDGQQRLTTATILLAAIRNTLYNIKDTQKYSEQQITRAKDYADTIQNEYLIKRIDGSPQRKIQTTTSFPYFTQTIQDFETRNTQVEPSTEEEELLKKTFDFFLNALLKENFFKKLTQHFNYKFTDEHYIDALKALRDQLLLSEIIDVFVAEKDQANKIFENINSKGKPLSQVDLIKNTIFSRINLTNAGIDEISMTWADFKKQLVDLDTTFDEFFLHYWKAVFPEDSPNGKNLYKKFNERFAVCSDCELNQFIDELKKGLKFYKMIVSPDRNNFTRKEYKAELDYLIAINRFKGVQVRPVLLSLYITNDRLGKKKLPQKEKTLFLQFVSNFHFAAFGTNLKVRSNKATGPYTNFTKSLYNATSKKEVQEALERLKKELIRVLPKEDFIKSFCNLEFSKQTAREGLDSFPASYAIRQLANLVDSRTHDDDEYSMEHIMDESLGNTNKIGNLIVLEEKYNRELNDEKRDKGGKITFAEKRIVYSKSKYCMVKEFSKQYNDFDHNSIPRRSKELASLFWERLLANK